MKRIVWTNVARTDVGDVRPVCFEQIAWVLPKELGAYDFLAANRELIANLATGRIKPGEILRATEKDFDTDDTEGH